MRNKRAKARPTPAMNVTPLVDVVLVLLIIFMVVVPAMEQGADVDLPKVLNVDPESKSKLDPFSLALASDGATYFEKDRVDAAALEARLREAHAREPERRVVLRADRRARYGDARALFGLCQRVGFPGVALRVSERERDEERSERAGAAPRGTTAAR